MKNINILRKGNIAGINSYTSKLAYYDAVQYGHPDEIMELSIQNHDYPKLVFENSSSYSEAMELFHYMAVMATAELCLISIQGGLPENEAYSIRDEFIATLETAVSLPDIYDLIHGMAHSFAARVRVARTKGLRSPQLNKMTAYIEAHLRDEITLQEVAEAAELSRNYASTVFKSDSGMTMNEYIMEARIREARRLLTRTTMPVAEIAEELKFCSQSYFTARFRRSVGKTPGEYRRNRTNV